MSYILINSRNYAKPQNHDDVASNKTANGKNIKFSLNKDGRKSVLENILQEFGPARPRKDRLLKRDDSSPKQLTFILKDISAMTYKFLASLHQTFVGRMTLAYLEKLPEAKANYDGD